MSLCFNEKVYSIKVELNIIKTKKSNKRKFI